MRDHASKMEKNLPEQVYSFITFSSTLAFTPPTLLMEPPGVSEVKKRLVSENSRVIGISNLQKLGGWEMKSFDLAQSFSSAISMVVLK